MALILIADESASERKRLRKIVEEEDHIVVEADNGNYAQELIEIHRLDVALLNINQEGFKEFDLLSCLQERGISAIAIKDYSEQIIPENVAVIEKNFSSSDIIKVLRKILDFNNSLPLLISSKKVIEKEEDKLNFSKFLSLKTLENLIILGIEDIENTLVEITDCPIKVKTPTITTTNSIDLQIILEESFGKDPLCVSQLGFKGGFSGTSQLFFITDNADLLTEALTGETPNSEDFQEAKEEMLTEIGNMVLNGILGKISNAMAQNLEFVVPKYIEANIENLLELLLEDSKAIILLAQSNFEIEELDVSGDIILFFKVN